MMRQTNYPTPEALRERADKLRGEIESASRSSEYPRRAKSVRIAMADALEEYASSVDKYGEQLRTTGNDRKARSARRQARLYLRAAKAMVESCECDMQSHAIANRRPFGQPILVGHHSEGRHRRDLQRQENLDRKRFELYEKAKRLKRSAMAVTSVAGSRVIFSDDENAIQKLEQKAQQLESERDKRKAINAEYRKLKGDIDAMTTVSDELKSSMKQLRENWYMGADKWRPFDAYTFQNTGAELRRIRNRISELKRREEAQERPVRTIGSIEIRDNLDFGKVELHFPGKPSDEIRTNLKRWGFRWVRTVGCWSRSINQDTETRLKWLAELLGEEIQAENTNHVATG